MRSFESKTDEKLSLIYWRHRVAYLSVFNEKFVLGSELGFLKFRKKT